MTLPYLNTITTGDARELARALPDSSVDLIFCDPVYERIEDYAWLAETAARVLRPGGSLLCFQWTGFLQQTFAAMSALSFEWMFSLYIPNRTKDTRCKAGFNKWTPCLWFSSGDAKSPRTADIMQCNAFQAVFGTGESNHPWSKSPEFIFHLMERFTRPGAIVFDPFTGGGTVPAVCKMLNRNYIAFEVDPATAERARQRVDATQAMHPAFTAEQEAMVLE